MFSVLASRRGRKSQSAWQSGFDARPTNRYEVTNFDPITENCYGFVSIFLAPIAGASGGLSLGMYFHLIYKASD